MDGTRLKRTSRRTSGRAHGHARADRRPSRNEHGRRHHGWPVPLLALILAACALLACLPGTTEALSGTSVYLYNGTNISYGGSYSTSWYYTTGENETSLAYCAEPSASAPSSGTYTTSSIESCDNYRTIASILWFGYGGPGFDEDMWPDTYYNGSSMGPDQYYVLTHIILARDYSHSASEGLFGTNAAFEEWCFTYILNYNSDDADTREWNDDAVHSQMCDRQDEVPESFVESCFLLITGSSTQVMIGYDWAGEVEVAFTKTSASASLTAGNSSYSLTGAMYTIYEKDTDSEVATVTIGKDGTATLSLEPDTDYYVVETTAPPGYQLNEDIIGFTTGDAGDTLEVDLTDNPITVEIAVAKRDSCTDDGSAQAGTTLEGAAFRLVDANGDSHTATTGSNGTATFAGIPLGAYTIYEVSAPDGYTITSETISGTASADDANDAGIVEIYAEFAEDVIAFDIQIVKTSTDETEGGTTRSGLMPELSGVAFEVISNTTGKVVATLRTDEDGYINTGDQDWIDWCIAQGYEGFDENTTTETLWFGAGSRPGDEGVDGAFPYNEDGYTIKEVASTTPEGLETADAWTISMDDVVNDEPLRYIVNDATIPTLPSIAKVDAETGEVVASADFQFLLYEDDGDGVFDAERDRLITMTDGYPSTTEVGTEQNPYTTANEGICDLPETLAYGDYWVREVNAVSPYLLADEVQKFTIDESTNGTITVTFPDPQAMGQATITKTCAEDGEAIEGTVYDVVAMEDVVSPDGTVRAVEGQVVDTVITGADGTATTCDLYLGSGSATYAFVEVENTDGYVLDGTPVEFTLTYADQCTGIVTAEAAQEDQPSTLIVQKVVDGSGDALAGATFSWWNVDDEMDAADGIAIDAGADAVVTIEECADEEDGSEAETKDGDVDESTVETDGEEAGTGDGEDEQAADGTGAALEATYDEGQGAWIVDGARLAAGTTYEVEVTDGGSNASIELSYSGSAIYLTFETGEEDGASLIEVPVVLIDGAEASSGTTDEDGLLTITHLLEGSYRIMETAAPAGYVADGAIYAFTVDANGQAEGEDVYTLTISNDYTKVYVSKYDVTGGTEVEGAELTILDADGNAYDSWTSAAEPHYLEAMPAGTYTLVEELTPHTYDEATAVEFTVLETGEIQTVVMYDEPIQITGEIDKKQEIADPVAEGTEADDDGANTAETSVSDDGSFDYTLDYRSTSSTWTDEFTVTDYLECAEEDLAYLTGITTAQAWEDYDGLMNVWYQTNLTETDHVEETDANATLSDGHTNSWLAHESVTEIIGEDGRVLDYTGWELWAEDVSTTESTYLSVEDLDLEEGEYVTAIRFEYGRVEEGFTTRTEGWDADTLKDAHDDVDDAADANAGDTFTDADGVEHAYASTVIHMQATESYVEGTVLANSAVVALFRNGGNTGTDEGLEDFDVDSVQQTPAIIEEAATTDLPQTKSAASITAMALITIGTAGSVLLAGRRRGRR